MTVKLYAPDSNKVILSLLANFEFLKDYPFLSHKYAGTIFSPYPLNAIIATLNQNPQNTDLPELTPDDLWKFDISADGSDQGVIEHIILEYLELSILNMPSLSRVEVKKKWEEIFELDADPDFSPIGSLIIRPGANENNVVLPKVKYFDEAYPNVLIEYSIIFRAKFFNLSEAYCSIDPLMKVTSGSGGAR